MLFPSRAHHPWSRTSSGSVLLAALLLSPLYSIAPVRADDDEDERPIRMPAWGYMVPLAPGAEDRDPSGAPRLPSGREEEEEEGDEKGPQQYDPKNLAPDPTPDLVEGISLNYRVYVPTEGKAWKPGTGADTEAQRVVRGDFPILNVLAPDWFFTGPAGQLNSQTPGAAGTVSGRVTDLAVDPSNSNTFYVAAAGGGVWKTTDGGATYVPLTDFQPNTSIGAVEVAPSNGQIVWVGTGEANFSGDSRPGSGLLKSTDGGTTWLVIPGPSNVFVRRSISRIIIDPTNPNTVYVSVTFGAGGFGGSYGVWKTTNGGTTWTNTFALTGNPGNGQPVVDMVMNPSTPQTLYAAFMFPSGGNTGAGIYKTVNGGTNWTLVDSSLPSGTGVGRAALGLCAAAPDTLYVGFNNPSTSQLLGVYKTTTGGTAAGSWTQLTAAKNYLSAGQGWYDNTVVVCPTNPNIAFFGGSTQSTGSVVCTNDGGTTWFTADLGQSNIAPHVDHHALAFLPDGRLLNGNDGGVWRMENASVPSALTSSSTIQWTNRNAGLGTIQFTGIALHPTQIIAYGGSQDNGTAKYNGTTWSLIVGGDGGFTRVDQTTPNTVYQSFNGISLRRSDNAGSTFANKLPSGATGGLFYPPYILDPSNQSIVLYGLSRLYRSVNRGDAWTTLTATSSNSITTIGAYGSTIYYAIGGAINASTDTGTTWTTVTPTSGNWLDIFVNPNYPADVYAVRGDFTGSSAGHVYRSTTGGASWTDISGNLKDQPYNAIKLDQKSGTIYVGGDDGVYFSTDYGASWSRLGTALPNVQVVDLVVNPGNAVLAAGTHGRGLWTYPLSTDVATANLYPQPTLSRNGSNQIVVNLSLRNAGNADTTNVVVTSVMINGSACSLTSGSSTVGTVPAYAARASTGVYTSTLTPAAGTALTVRVQGTSTQGAFYFNLRLTAP